MEEATMAREVRELVQVTQAFRGSCEKGGRRLHTAYTFP